VLFSRSLEFWVGACRNWGSRKPKNWEPTRRGVWTPGRWDRVPGTFLASGVWSGSKLIRPKGFRDTVTLWCWNLPLVGQLFVDQPGWFAITGPVCRSSRVARRWSLPRRAQWRGASRPASKFVDGPHVLRLEWKKSMDFTLSSHNSCVFYPSRDTRDEVALSESVPTGARMKER